METQVRDSGVAVGQRWNPWAVMSLAFAFLCWPVSILFGHIALSEIRGGDGTQRGRGLAMSGLVISYVGIVMFILAVLLHSH